MNPSPAGFSVAFPLAYCKMTSRTPSMARKILRAGNSLSNETVELPAPIQAKNPTSSPRPNPLWPFILPFRSGESVRPPPCISQTKQPGFYSWSNKNIQPEPLQNLRKQCSKVTVLAFRVGLDGHPEIGCRAALEGERRPRMP